MRLVVRILGRDILEVTTDPDDDPTLAVQGFGFAAGTSLYMERADELDEDANP